MPGRQPELAIETGRSGGRKDRTGRAGEANGKPSL